MNNINKQITDRMQELNLMGEHVLAVNPQLPPMSVTKAILGLQEKRMVIVRTDDNHRPVSVAVL